jgi:transposase
MAKFTIEKKVQAVREYLAGHESIKQVAKRHKVSIQVLHHWIKRHRHHGEDGLRKRYTNYTPEYKMDVLNFMNDTGASPTEAAAVFDIPSKSTVANWKRALNQIGPDALIPKKKGRPPMKEKPKKPILPKESNETLQEEVERLRMENAYLKKLNALVKEKERSQRNSKSK